jgi:CHAT domain-containing protein
MDQPHEADATMIKELKARVNASPPKKGDNLALANFYYRRGDAAIQLGRHNQALEDLRLASYYSAKTGSPNRGIMHLLAIAEFVCGNFKRAIELLEEALDGERPSPYQTLVKLYTRVGDLESAERVKRQGIALCNRLRGRSGSGAWPDIHGAYMEAYLLEALGKFAEAEPHYRRILRSMTLLMKEEYPISYIVAKIYLVHNLKNQGRLVEAELEARETLKEALGVLGRDSEIAGSTIGDLGEIILRQDRVFEAENLMRAGIRTVAEAGVSPDSYLMAQGRMWLGDVLTDKYEFAGAMKQYDLARDGMRENQYLYEKFFSKNPNLMLSLLKTDRYQEAMTLISRVYEINRQVLGNGHYATAETIALRGMANAKMKRLDRSLGDFSEAVPIVLEQSHLHDDHTRRRRLKIIIEAYMDLLSEIQGTQLESDEGIDAVAEAFKLADFLAGHSVRSALGASSARAAAVNPDLADLIRREQDALKQIHVLETSLTDVVAAPADQQLPAVIKNLRTKIEIIKNLRTKIEILTKARDTLRREIQTRFPKYSEFTNPQPLTLAEVQGHLQPDEALVSIYPSERRTYVWAIPYKGEVKFSPVLLGEKEISRMLSDLRKALDPEPRTFGDIPEFDLDLAYDLYRKLLKPVEDAWKGVTDLVVIAHGPLGQLPFSLLPTTPVKLGKERAELFGNYRQVPWLIRNVSITRLPSASSLVTLRKLPEGNPFRKTFAGFGDPFFNKEQFAQAKGKGGQKVMPGSPGGRLHVRGIRLTQTGNLDSETIISSHLGLLKRLPDTGEEIRSIAKALDADLDEDIFLGERASEGQVKTMDLSDRRVIAFATHALVPGDLDGLYQPALALASPSVIGDNEDGLLTMGEIMRLKLNSDWVVLSACNTGAAHGAGAEAVSGLGRAFFYAGTRAILVSMWPVETTSAKKLTTGLFRYQKEDKTLSRTRALRKSIIGLIDGPGIKDNATGKIIASYAHPMFWAPFTIVGDGR